jgi:hypothetical protein
MKQAKRKRGGQPKPASERKRNNLTIRVLDHLRQKLEKAAQASQRSVSEEAAHRMMLGFNLENELTDYAKLREATDEELLNVALKRGWASILDLRYGGPILIPPGQVATKINELIESAKTGQVGSVLPPATEAAITRAVEKAVAAALARATVRLGGNNE